MKTQAALVIIDAQHCFMPAEEGERLGLGGFGELPVTDGQEVVEPINALTHAVRRDFWPILTTQDQHPEETAHFSEHPDYVTTWSKHGRANTPGGELHPELLVAQHPSIAERFIKGTEAAHTPAEDTSYTGALAFNPETGEKLPDALRRLRVQGVYLCGLALGQARPDRQASYCVDQTAMDLVHEGFNVTLATDAVKPIRPEDREIAYRNLGKIGVRLMTVAQILEEITA